MLLPLSEACLLGLDLLREPPAELFLFLLELRVVELLHLALTVLARLHLLLAIVLVMTLLRSRDKVEHEGTNEKGAQLAEVAMVLVFHCASASIPLIRGQKAEGGYTLGNTPEVLAALHDATIRGLDVLSRANDRKWHSLRKDARVLSAGLIICLDGGLVNTNVLGGDDVPNLTTQYVNGGFNRETRRRTRCLKVNKSLCVRVSALAMTGMRLTRVPRRFIISMSSGLRLRQDYETPQNI